MVQNVPACVASTRPMLRVCLHSAEHSVHGVSAQVATPLTILSSLQSTWQSSAQPSPYCCFPASVYLPVFVHCAEQAATGRPLQLPLPICLDGTKADISVGFIVGKENAGKIGFCTSSSLQAVRKSNKTKVRSQQRGVRGVGRKPDSAKPTRRPSASKIML